MGRARMDMRPATKEEQTPWWTRGWGGIGVATGGSIWILCKKINTAMSLDYLQLLLRIFGRQRMMKALSGSPGMNLRLGGSRNLGGAQGRISRGEFREKG